MGNGETKSGRPAVNGIPTGEQQSDSATGEETLQHTAVSGRAKEVERLELALLGDLPKQRLRKMTR